MNLQKVKKRPVTAAESRNFYFLVKQCGISPLDVPHMTPLQQQILINHQNKIDAEQKKKNEEMQRKQSSSKRRAPRRRRR